MACKYENRVPSFRQTLLHPVLFCEIWWNKIKYSIEHLQKIFLVAK